MGRNQSGSGRLAVTSITRPAAHPGYTRRMTWPARLLLLAAALALPTAASAARQVTQGPAPRWVVPSEVPQGPAPTTGEAGGDVAFLLVDDQVRPAPGGLEHYQRLVQQVVATTGVDDASEVRIDFDPAYQQVILHEVVIRRGKTARNALKLSELKLIQREAELDKRIYDGRLTAVLFLHDVRVGDVVDVTWTIRGQNPVYGGRTALGFDLGWGVPVSRLSLRVLWPEGRPLAVKVHGEAPEPTRTARGGEVEYRLIRAPAPAALDESDLPPGVDPFPWVEFSEWGSWAEVVRWALPLYAPGPTAGAVEAKAAEWRSLPDEAARVRAALRFVQDEVRYLGMELGTGSHQPTAPAEVLQRRFGDCKDKSLLLVALLKALGVEAAPALVNTDEQAAIVKRLPTPKAFDHVVVRAWVGGVERWLEPTRSLERGPVEALVPPGYQRALVLAPGETGLSELPEPRPSLVDISSTWKVARWSDPVEFEVVTRYEGLRAVSMRHELADTTPAQLQRGYLEYYSKDEPKVEVAAPLQIEDAADADRVVITERYRLPAATQGERRDFAAEAIQKHLKIPKTSRRELPLRLAHPALVREHLSLDLPGPPAINPEEKVVEDEAMRLTRRARASGTRYTVDFELKTLRTAVEPKAVPAHLAKLRDMQDLAAFSLPMEVVKAQPAKAARTSSEPPPAWVWALVLGGGLLAGWGLVAGARAARAGMGRWGETQRPDQRTQAFFQGLVEQPGETARTPLRLHSLADLGRAAQSRRCRCGAPLTPDPATTEAIRMGDDQVQVARATCARCAQITPVYFTVG